MVKFGGLITVGAMALLVAGLASGSGFVGVGLLVALVAIFAIVVSFFNELRRVLN